MVDRIAFSLRENDDSGGDCGVPSACRSARAAAAPSAAATCAAFLRTRGAGDVEAFDTERYGDDSTELS